MFQLENWDKQHSCPLFQASSSLPWGLRAALGLEVLSQLRCCTVLRGSHRPKEDEWLRQAIAQGLWMRGDGHASLGKRFCSSLRMLLERPLWPHFSDTPGGQTTLFTALLLLMNGDIHYTLPVLQTREHFIFLSLLTFIMILGGIQCHSFPHLLHWQMRHEEDEQSTVTLLGTQRPYLFMSLIPFCPLYALPIAVQQIRTR